MVLEAPSKVPAIADGVAEEVVSIVSQYRNAAMMSAGTAPFAVHGTTLAKSPGPLVQGTPLKLIVPVGSGALTVQADAPDNVISGNKIVLEIVQRSLGMRQLHE